MKILFIKSQFNSNWEGMWISALKKHGFNVKEIWIYSNYNYFIKRLGTLSSWLSGSNLGKYFYEKYKDILNRSIIDNLEESFDIVFVYNGWMELTDSSWRLLKTKSSKIISLQGDNPFIYLDPRFNLLSYISNVDVILTADRYVKFLSNFYPSIKTILIPAGTAVESFHPCTPSKKEIKDFECEVLFVGNGYGKTPFGYHRASIINSCIEYNLKVFGTSGWKHLFKHYPEIQKKYIHKNLTIHELNVAHNVAKITLALTNALAVDGSHVRVFDIIASGGFPLIEHRDYIVDLFPRDTVVTFKNLKDLKEKVEYYLENENERIMKSKATYDYLIKNYTIDKIVLNTMNEVIK